MKNTIALNVGDQAVVGSHVGDLDNALSLDVHRRAITDLVSFFGVEPQTIACDLHPDYSTTQHAVKLAQQWNARLVRVQHHHAHVLSAVAEHQLAGPTLGLAWDGTGYGSDGAIWGGEALVVDGSEWRRVAHLRPFSLPGGDRAARDPRRSALGILFEWRGDQCGRWAADWFSESELAPLLAALKRPHLFPRTTSMGRLFDAVAALCGYTRAMTFEGQAAMWLEHVVDMEERRAYAFDLLPGPPGIADWSSLLEQVMEDRKRGVAVGRISARFHNALSRLAVQVAQSVSCRQVVLTGGCFQNRRLSERAETNLSAAGFQVYTQRKVPPGDGGLALGQLLGAIYEVGE